VKVCDKTCIFFFFPIMNKYFLLAKRSLLSRCPSYMQFIVNLHQKCICDRQTDIPVNHGSGYDSKTSTWLRTMGPLGGRSDPQLVRRERLHGCQGKRGFLQANQADVQTNSQ
jgi:hypothetical protein